MFKKKFIEVLTDEEELKLNENLDQKKKKLITQLSIVILNSNELECNVFNNMNQEKLGLELLNRPEKSLVMTTQWR